MRPPGFKLVAKTYRLAVTFILKVCQMAKHFVSTVLICALVAGFATAQQIDQPLKRAKVGDYVVFKTDSPGVKMTMRQEVTEVTEKTVTIKSVSTVNGMELPADVKTEDLTKSADPAVIAENVKKFKVVDTGKGTETLKINGKEYRCEWKSMTTTVTANGMEIKTESKLWMSKDAPVYGLVKTETKTFGMVTVMELTESGSKK